MAFIIDPKPQKDAVKEVVHISGCGALVGYVKNDVLEDYTTDYTGDRDYYRYIYCPNCGKQIHVKG